MEFKPDFEQACRRWRDLWSGRKLDRPLFLIAVPRPERQRVNWPYPIRPDRDIGPCIDQTLAWAAGREYLAEAFPFITLEFGPEHFATFLGAEMRYHPTVDSTGWTVPFVEDWDDAEIRFRPESFYWRRTVEVIRAFRARCDGRLLVNAPALVAGLDALAAVRDPQRLLTDMVDCPEKVSRALADVRRAYHEIVEALAVELGWSELGSGCWLGMYHPGRTHTLQCDLSCMISERTFEEMEVGALAHEAGHYDAVSYHLDGPGAVRHLPAICRTPGLSVVQYVPVPRETPEEIEAVYHRIDELGMGIIRNARPGDARRLWEESSTKRLVLILDFATAAEARDFIDKF